MSADKARGDWSVFVLPVVGLLTAVFQAFTAWRGSKTTEPTQPRQPTQPPPVPPERADAAITAAQHEAIRREAEPRTQPTGAAPISPLADPEPDPDVTPIPGGEGPPSDGVLEPRDMQ